MAMAFVEGEEPRSVLEQPRRLLLLSLWNRKERLLIAECREERADRRRSHTYH